MSSVTNNLVGRLRSSMVPASVAATVALGVVLFVNHNGVHASAVTASQVAAARK